MFFHLRGQLNVKLPKRHKFTTKMFGAFFAFSIYRNSKINLTNTYCYYYGEYLFQFHIHI